MQSKVFSSLGSIALLFLIVCCSNPPIQPTEQYYSIIKASLNVGYPLNIEQDSLIYRSSLLQLGTLGLKSYGICYGQKQNPTVFDKVEWSKTPIDSIPALFDNKVKNLTAGTTYQVRSFIITAKDTIYGPNNFFRTPGPNEWLKRVIVSPYIIPLTNVPAPISTAFDDKKIFLFFQSQNRLTEYDTKRYTWEEKKSLPSALNSNLAKYSFMLNNKVYCGNIQVNIVNKSESEFWEYDVPTNNWRNLGANKPDITAGKPFGFTDNKFGYVLALSAKNSWNLWRFNPTNTTWTLANEYFDNETVTNLLSDGTNTFAITKSNAIYKFNGQQWQYFMNIADTFRFKGKDGYYGWVLKGKIYIGEYEGRQTAVWKSIDIASKAIEALPNTAFALHTGPYQTSQKMFFGKHESGPLLTDEFFPK